MKNSHYAIIAVLIFLVGGGAFYGGMQYQKSQGGTGRGGANGQFRTFTGGNTQFAGRGGAQGGVANGEVLSTDDQGITLKLMDGGSKIVFFSASTTIGKTEAGSKDDLTAGTNVLVTGTPNADGSITANMVQIRPAGSPNVMMRFDNQAPRP
jgi:tripartite-type tricarboxylate transporter receptor subunit TctC